MRMVSKLGLLSLGRAPAEHVTQAFRSAIKKKHVNVYHKGCLDGFKEVELMALLAQDGEEQIAIDFQSGEPLKLSADEFHPHLVNAGLILAAECDVVLLLDLKEIPPLAEACPKVIQPIHYLRGLVQALMKEQVVGVIGPFSGFDTTENCWISQNIKIIHAEASPSSTMRDVLAAAHGLTEQGATAFLLSDFQFNERHRGVITQTMRKPVLCATTLVARFLKELL